MTNFNYRGRIPKRSDGKLRREALLNAALDIVVEQGVRGVRHRAVAEKANVPLAATTYYFDDIFDLIHDAFLFAMEMSYKDVAELEKELLTTLSLHQSKEGAISVDQLIDLTVVFMLKMTKDPRQRLLEQAIRAEALRDRRIADIVRFNETVNMEMIEKILTHMNLSKIPLRTMVIYSTYLRLEFQLTVGLIDEEQVIAIAKEVFTAALSPNFLS
ncbi:MAG: hypothetical protein V2I33_15000 [Kangiellaceae bacterium]|jgi:DNA-binding transcriptional regulator YbjK|nr:hypothetical protein [Kangiellaceae bacterium]